MREWITRALLIAALVGAGWAVQRAGGLEVLLEAVRGLGPLAVPAFVALHALSVVVLLPSVVPTLAAGGLFGLAVGLPVSLVGAGLGALAAFGIGRTVARAQVERRLAGDRRFQALARLSSERGWRIVALARLTPIFPFSLGNYAFGVTAIPALHYAGASVLGTLPSNAVYVYLGAVAGDVASGEGRTPLEWGLLALGGVATVALVAYLQRLARQELSGAAESV